MHKEYSQVLSSMVEFSYRDSKLHLMFLSCSAKSCHYAAILFQSVGQATSASIIQSRVCPQIGRSEMLALNSRDGQILPSPVLAWSYLIFASLRLMLKYRADAIGEARTAWASTSLRSNHQSARNL